MKKITEALNAIVLTLMLLMTVGQILFRSVFKISASWSEELIQYSFAFIVFVGAISVTKDESHITITMGLDMMPPTLKRIVRVVGRFFVLPFLFVFTYGAFQNAGSTWTAALPTAEWMKIGYMYGILFVSGLSMILFTVFNIVQDIRGKLSTAPAEGGAE